MSTISAIVCTYRRFPHLHKVLASLVGQSLPRDQYEVLVVDNGCEDEVRALVEQYATTARVRYVREPHVGLVRARNTGVERAEGEYVAFIDDDAEASAVWLSAILRAFEAGGPGLASVGGRVGLLWQQPRPEWLSDNLLPALGYLDYGPAPRLLDRGEWLYGLNIAFRGSALVEVGGFAVGLGREGSKKHLISNEEILVQIKLAERGYTRWYDPKAFVQHHVAADRLDPAWFARRYYWQGVSSGIMDRLLRKPTYSSRARRALGDFLRLSRQPVEVLESVLQRGRAVGLERRCGTLERLGRLRGWCLPLRSL